GRMLDQEFAQRHGLMSQPKYVAVAREKIARLVAENAQTTRLQSDYRRAVPELRLHFRQRRPHGSPRPLGKSKVIDRTAAALDEARKRHLESGIFQHARRGHRRFGMEIVVESIRPQHYRRTILIARRPRLEPSAEGPPRKRRHRALRCDACHPFGKSPQSFAL